MASDEQHPSAAASMREQRLQRNLKIIVGALTVLILLGLGAVIARVVGLASGQRVGEGVRSPALATAGTVSLDIPKGAKILSVSLSGNRLAIEHEGPDGTGISILDLETGRTVLEVKPVEALPRN